jgi:hypothetical protein
MAITRKLTISLTERGFAALGEFVRIDNANASVELEVGLELLRELPEPERRRRVREMLAGRRATTPSAWVSNFWDGLAQDFDAIDFDRTGTHTMTVRQYDHFDVKYFSNPPTHDDGRLHFEAVESQPIVAGIESVRLFFDFALEDSPYAASRAIAKGIREARPRAAKLRAARLRAVPDLGDVYPHLREQPI